MSRASVGKLSAAITLITTAIPVFAQRAVVDEKDIVKAIVDQFDKSDLVGLGEFHGSQADQDLRFQVIHSKAFATKVRFIAVEGLNAFYQEDLDRYIRGEDVPLEQVQKVWRDSTGIFIGSVIRTTYQQFLSEVRSVNRGLPDRMKLRVIAADPPLDWAKVQTTADFRAVLSKRVAFGVDAIEREVLQKGQKALLVFAGSWFTRNMQHKTANGLVPWTETIGAGLDRDYPGRLYVIAPVRSGEYPDSAKVERLIGVPASPVLLRLHGTAFGALDPNEFLPANAGALLGGSEPAVPYVSRWDYTQRCSGCSNISGKSRRCGRSARSLLCSRHGLRSRTKTACRFGRTTTPRGARRQIGGAPARTRHFTIEQCWDSGVPLQIARLLDQDPFIA